MRDPYETLGLPDSATPTDRDGLPATRTPVAPRPACRPPRRAGAGSRTDGRDRRRPPDAPRPGRHGPLARPRSPHHPQATTRPLTAQQPVRRRRPAPPSRPFDYRAAASAEFDVVDTPRSRTRRHASPRTPRPPQPRRRRGGLALRLAVLAAIVGGGWWLTHTRPHGLGRQRHRHDRPDRATTTAARHRSVGRHGGGVLRQCSQRRHTDPSEPAPCGHPEALRAAAVVDLAVPPDDPGYQRAVTDACREVADVDDLVTFSPPSELAGGSRESAICATAP